jgi:hypothetical protein
MQYTSECDQPVGAESMCQSFKKGIEFRKKIWHLPLGLFSEAHLKT